MADRFQGCRICNWAAAALAGRRSLPDMASRYESEPFIPAFNWQQHVIAPWNAELPITLWIVLMGFLLPLPAGWSAITHPTQDGAGG